MDFSQLTRELFDLLVARLMTAEGFTIVETGAARRGLEIDFIVTPPDSASPWVVETKYRNPERVHRSELQSLIGNLAAVRTLVGMSRGLLVICADITASTRELVVFDPDVVIWERSHLQEMLARHPEIVAEFTRLVEQARRFEESQGRPNQRQITDLIFRLSSPPRGRDHFRQYEDLGVEILNCLFVPPLGLPRIQPRSEDGLDRRDAIYPIVGRDYFWSLIRSDYRSRMVLTEFKNYTDPITQTQIETTKEYLYAKALRMFALLCSRDEPAESARVARRRAWNEHDKMIVFLSDRDLTEMLQIRAEGGDSTQVITQQLDAFLTQLAP
jgi:hypothetical protein